MKETRINRLRSASEVHSQEHSFYFVFQQGYNIYLKIVPLFSRLIHDPAHQQRTVYTFCVIPLLSQTTHRQVYSKKEDKLRDLLSFVMLVAACVGVQTRLSFVCVA